MSKVIRPNEGRWFLGVCKGLERSGRGSALLWRLIFGISSYFTFGIAILIYLSLAVIFPYDKSK